MITHEDVIAWQTAQLNQQTNQPMSAQMRAYVDAHADLQQELTFLKQMWQVDDAPFAVPSARMQDNFAKQLAQHKANQVNQAKQTRQSDWLATLRNWFGAGLVYQVCGLALVFVLGMWVNQNQGQDTQKAQLAQLQQDVSSLSAFIAITMLQKPSASERLTGVAYSRQSDLSDPVLNETMLGLIEHDKSTAVRLAVIDALGQHPLSHQIEQRLLDMTLNESNPLVQMELCRLLLALGSSDTQSRLIREIDGQLVNPDVVEFIESIQQRSQI